MAPRPGSANGIRRTLTTLYGAGRVYWRAAPGVASLRMSVAVSGGAFPVVVAWLTKLLLDRAVGQPGPPIAVIAAVLALVGGVATVLEHLARYLDAEIVRRVSTHTQAELFASVNREPGLATLEDPAYHDRVQLAQQSSQSAPVLLTMTVLSMAQSLVTVAGFTFSLLTLFPLAAVLVLTSIVPTLAAQLRLSRARSAAIIGNSPRLRRQRFYSTLLLDLRAAKEIRLYGLGQHFHTSMLAELGAAQRAERTVDRSTARVDSLLSLMTATVAGVVLVLATTRVAAGEGRVGDLAVLVAALAAVQLAVAGIVAQFATANQSLILFAHYLAVTARPADPPSPVLPTTATPTLRQGIRFEGVWFRYHPDQPWVLSELDLTLPHGRTVALVGFNGAGKSTVVKLLCRLYEPTVGRITWDGIDLRDLDVDTLRARIGTVFQDHVQYEFTARDNIGLGDLDADDGAVRAAADRAGVHEVIAALPQGYHTMLTRTFAAGPTPPPGAAPAEPGTGVELSGGQWQRLAVARALLRDRSDLLILDEPSSGLDAQAEHELHRTLRGLRADRTTLLISHRLGTTRDADQIVVLTEGRISEHGDHDTLIRADGRYAELFRLQADGYAGALSGGEQGAT